MSNILDKIVDTKKQEVVIAKKGLPLSNVEQQLTSLASTRKFRLALENKVNARQPGVIAEIKQASPSKGLLTDNFQPLELASAYQNAGATCISVLTDIEYFAGDPDYIKQVKQVAKLPILRKDFIIDEYQVYQSRHIGADAILLIAAILSAEQLQDYYKLARELDLDVLVEIHDKTELEAALHLPDAVLGINNRNLRTFKTDIQTTIDLLSNIPADKLVVTESGINSSYQVKKMIQSGVYCFLVGESLMRADNVLEKYSQMFEI